jgi:hypothetical protein
MSLSLCTFEFLIFSSCIPEIQVYLLSVQALQLGQEAFNPYEFEKSKMSDVFTYGFFAWNLKWSLMLQKCY